VHDLADEIRSFELGADAAAAVLLSLIERAEVEVRGFDDPADRMQSLHGAIIAARVAGRCSNTPDNGRGWMKEQNQGGQYDSPTVWEVSWRSQDEAW
jgi:hypothetical protein